MGEYGGTGNPFVDGGVTAVDDRVDIDIAAAWLVVCSEERLVDEWWDDILTEKERDIIVQRESTSRCVSDGGWDEQSWQRPSRPRSGGEVAVRCAVGVYVSGAAGVGGKEDDIGEESVVGAGVDVSVLYELSRESEAAEYREERVAWRGEWGWGWVGDERGRWGA